MSNEFQQRSDGLKRAIAGTVRALSTEKELAVNFAGDTVRADPETVQLPAPPRDLTSQDIDRLRGQGDSVALKMRHHDKTVHAKRRPPGHTAQAIYDAVEQARCEALGSRNMKGVAQNLEVALEAHCRAKGLDRITRTEDVPIAEAVRFLARERLTGAPPPKSAEQMVDLWRPWVESKAAEDLEHLTDAVDDQAQFSNLLRQLIAHLDFADENENLDDLENQSEDEQDSADNTETQSEGETGESEMEATSAPSPDTAESEAVDAETSEAEAVEDPDMADGEEAGSDGEPYRPPEDRVNRPPAYTVYTDAFDEIIDAADLCEPEELTRLRGHLDQQLAGHQGVITRLANRLQRKLLAKQTRSWEFDLDEGLLDTARLARVVTNPTYPLSYKLEQETEFRDTVVTLLLDNSGSMRGRPIGVAAMSADIMARTLERCGVKVEILGFTTKAWKGGRARERWLASGKPGNPGRLNELRHIIYKAADTPYRRARRSLGLMLREGLLKENIDGEALLWAHNRLIGRPEQRRILMVISDGAPVDDSTLSVNSGNYLDRHLRDVIGWIEGQSPIQLVAIGIGHDVTRYYRRAVTIVDADQLGSTMTDKLAELFDEDSDGGTFSSTGNGGQRRAAALF